MYIVYLSHSINLEWIVRRNLTYRQISKKSYRVHTGPGKPGNSWNFIVAFSRTGWSWKKAAGPRKSW